MQCKSLRFNPSWFISDRGYVFRIEGGKEMKIPIVKARNTKASQIFFEGKPYRLLELMIEYFIGAIKLTDRLSYTACKDGSIPLNNIKVKSFVSKYTGLSNEDEVLLFKYGCDTKAWSANGRSNELITPVEVYISLKTHNFRCLYCNRLLRHDKWHLDHYYPLSKPEGKNIFENIVPACGRCNIMKGNMAPLQFIAHCGKVVLFNKVGNDEINKSIING